jgi:glyoxylase-like metal-dependent hydrolase (beta-lactamase superfamily II)
MSGASTTAAATGAGIPEVSLRVLEQTGHPPEGVNWEGLAQAVDLHAAKLKGIANGWTPAPVDLSLWRELRVITTTEEGMGVNCFLVWDEVSRDAAMFDTGWNPKPVIQLVEENNLILRHLFITHSHEDHIAGVGQIRAVFPKVRLHTGSRHAPVEQRNRANDFIQLGSLRISNRDTPGHAEDGTTYIVGNWPEDAPAVAIVGDAIFAGSMGKGNISWELARQKVREQILTLPEDTLIGPGHGPLTTVREEKLHNPFF